VSVGLALLQGVAVHARVLNATSPLVDGAEFTGEVKRIIKVGIVSQLELLADRVSYYRLSQPARPELSDV
jgi:hypothetical protein